MSMGMKANADGSIELLANGATKIKVNADGGVNNQGPCFSAYRNPASAQSVPSSTWTKVQSNAEEFDTANCYDSTTNFRFQPNVAGYYRVSGQVCWNGATSAATTAIGVYKNGSLYKRGNAFPMMTGDSAQPYVSALVYLNGTTDYVELWTYQGQGTALSLIVIGNGTENYFQGELVRAA